jgi:hypothetical protein
VRTKAEPFLTLLSVMGIDKMGVGIQNEAGILNFHDIEALRSKLRRIFDSYGTVSFGMRSLPNSRKGTNEQW